MAVRLRRINSGDDGCQADVCQSRWSHSAVNRERRERGIEREAHSDGNQLSSHCFHFTRVCEGSPPEQRIPRVAYLAVATWSGVCCVSKTSYG